MNEDEHNGWMAEAARINRRYDAMQKLGAKWGYNCRKHSMHITTQINDCRGKWPRWIWRLVRRLSAFAWGWEIARTKELAMLTKCHEDNCRAISQLAHELEEARKAERLARVQLSHARGHTIFPQPNNEISRRSPERGENQ